MVVRRRRKSRKLRGRTRTMGWGRIGQHRGHGAKGGHGAAGMHKHRWSWVIKYAPTWFGKHGFNVPYVRKAKTRIVNIGWIEENIEYLLRAGVASKDETGVITVDITKLGFNKLGGQGRISRVYRIVAPEATHKAVEKVKAAGGVVVPP